jgi:hypothetical protein
MADDIQNKQNEIQAELKASGVSRRGFIDRIKALGFGFGAAFTLGVEASQARNAPDTAVNLNSTNPALDAIINEQDKQQSQNDGEKRVQEAWYRRVYRRGFAGRRYGRGFRRFFRRW